MIQIYHNSRCTKSRECLAFIEETGQEFKVINYLKDIPTEDELRTIINKLGIQPIELVRQKEKVWLENFKAKNLSDDAIIQAMLANPILIERPIVVNNDRAAIARPLEKAIVILK